MANVMSNHCKYQLAVGNINFSTDSFKMLLMASGFTFNKDTHATYSDVSTSELGEAYGYTQNTKVMTASPTVTEDDTNDRCSVVWADVIWAATGGSIGPTPGAIIINDTTSDDSVVGYIDFSSEQTATTGTNFTISAPTIYVA